MKIYLDGCDGVGKSTLANYLSERFCIDKFCLTKDSEKSIDRYKSLTHLDNVVYDRTFLSEVVYPEIFGREEWLSENDIEYLLDCYRKEKCLIVICTASNETIRDRILARGVEFFEVIKNIANINTKYRELAMKYNLLLVNTQCHTSEEIGDMIERRLKNGRHYSR